MGLEEAAIAAGMALFGAVAYLWGRSRVASPPEDPDIIEATDLRHQHTRWKKDLSTDLYYCVECGDRYLDGKPGGN